MSRYLINGLLGARFVLFGSVVLALILLAAFGQRVSYQQSINSFFADDDPAIRVYRQASQIFGDDNFVFVVYDDPALITPAGLDRVAELASALDKAHIPGVDRVESIDVMPLLWIVDDALLALDRLPGLARKVAFETAKRSIKDVDLKTSGMTVRAAVRGAANDRKALAALKERIIHHPLFLGTLVNSTATSTALVARLNKTDKHNVIDTVNGLRAAADEFAARHDFKPPAVVGPPVLLADGFAAIEIDGRRLAVVGMVLIGVVTLSAVRSLWWAIVPMLAGWVIWLATETILGMFDIKLALSGGPLVAQIIVLTMPAASHLAIHFRDDRRSESDPRKAAHSTLRAVAAPIAWTAITGAIGYGALFTSHVMPIRQFGAILGTCTLGAAILVMLISPIAMLPPFPLEVPVRHGSHSRVSAVMNRLILFVYKRPWTIVGGMFAVVVPLALGLFGLRYETNYINLFRRETRVVRDYNTVESTLGGIGVVELIVPVGKTIEPKALADLDNVGAQIAETRVTDPGGVAQVLSLATVLDPDRRLAALPVDRQRRILADKLELIGASTQSHLLNSFWNSETGDSRMLIRIKEQQAAVDKSRIFERAVAAAREIFGPASYLTGLSFLMTKTTEAIIATQWTTFLWSAIGILLMLSLAFRSVTVALLALLPTLLSVALVLGLMGWLRIKLDMATALVASVALGLSVDDTFHCLLQFRRDHQKERFRRRLFASYRVSGPGVMLSSLAVAIGFAALRTSEFEPFVNFGTMVGIATAGSTIGNLILLPACLTLGNRWLHRAEIGRRGAIAKPATVTATAPAETAG
jgi:predicted RND superfamily exporter protein